MYPLERPPWSTIGAIPAGYFARRNRATIDGRQGVHWTSLCSSRLGTPSFALLAREVDGTLNYAGSGFITPMDAERERFWRAIDRLACEAPVLPMAKGYDATWCRPELRVSARHLKGGDKLRHTALAGLA